MANQLNLTDQQTYQNTLMGFFNGDPADTEADLQKVLHPDFHLRADGDEQMDFAAFVKHMTWLRGMKRDDGLRVTLQVVQFVCDGRQIGERHTSTTVMPDGKVMSAETFQFVELAEDGRMRSIVESVVGDKGKKDGE